MTRVAHWLGGQRIDLEACGSTNDEAARMARAGAKHGTVVIAEHQTHGRGREGRAWAAASGNLYLSAVLRPPLPLVDVPPMTLAIGIGVCDTVRSFGAPAVLKWPNDLLVGDRKLAGVLVEAQSQGNRLDAVVVGIGVNVDTTPDPVAHLGTSVAEAAGTTIDREAFITALLANVELWVDRYVAIGLEAVISAWRDRMAVGLAARAIVDGRTLTGLVAGLAADGALLLREADGQLHQIRSGDVEMIRRGSVGVGVGVGVGDR